MNDNLNVERNKRLLMRLGNLNKNYKSNIVTSYDFTETGSSYSMNVVANNILGTNISSGMKVVDHKIDMDGRLVINGDVFYIGSGFDGVVYSLIETTDGGYLVVGDFTTYSGQTTNRIIKLKSDGSVDDTFDSGDGFDYSVLSIIETTDGGYLIGGDFASYSGQTANYIIKLKSDGSVDDTFDSGDGFNNIVYSITETSDGGYLVGGRFTSYSGQTANRIIKLKSDGSVDDTFDSGDGFNNFINSLIQTTDGGYLIVGRFTSYSGQTTNRIIKLKSDGSVDDTFDSGDGFNNVVSSLIQTTDGGYLVGGNFASYSGQTANKIIKLKSDGRVDDTFNSGDGFNDAVRLLIETSDGGYLVGGGFTSYSGQTANSIIKLKSNGSVDTSFNSGSGFNNDVNSLIETTDGGYLIVGNFTSYSGQTANKIIKLKSDGSSVTISE